MFYDNLLRQLPELPPEKIIHASSRQTAIMMAAAGLGVAIIAESIRHMCLEVVDCIPLEGDLSGPDIVMGWKKGKTNSLAAFFEEEL